MTSRAEEYRKYLDANGIADHIKEALTAMYEESEWPENPLEFVSNHLGGKIGNVKLKDELKKAEEKANKLQEQVNVLEKENSNMLKMMHPNTNFQKI